MYDAQKEQFATQGYAVFEGALVGPLLDLLRGQCEEFIAREDERMDALGVDSIGITHRGRRYFANECQRVQPALRAMLFSRVMADVCRATLGDDAYFYFDQYVVKGPDGGLPFAWHQDSGYMQAYGGPKHRPYLTCWCPLDDATVENGTVRLLPFPAMPETREQVLPHGLQDGTNDLVGWTGPDEVGVVVEAPAGSVVAFSSYLLHATGSNATSQMRRVYLAQYSPEVILFDDHSPHLRRNAVPLLRRGEHVTTA